MSEGTTLEIVPNFAPKVPSRSPVWAFVGLHGTHTEHLSWGEYGRPTHVQSLYDAWPWPKTQVAGIGSSVRKGRSWLAGGIFGAGSDRRVDAVLDFMESANFDRLLVLDHSRGIEVAARLIRTLEKIRNRAAKKGHRPPPWAHIDVLASLDPVASVGLNGIWKWATGVLPAKARWALNIEGVRQLPSFVEASVSLYCLHERRSAFEPTHLLVAPGKAQRKWWMAGEHRDAGGYPDGDPRPSRDFGSMLRSELIHLHPELETVPMRWPWPALVPEEWEEAGASPVTRRALPGDMARVRRVIP